MTANMRLALNCNVFFNFKVIAVCYAQTDVW